MGAALEPKCVASNLLKERGSWPVKMWLSCPEPDAGVHFRTFILGYWAFNPSAITIAGSGTVLPSFFVTTPKFA